MKPISFDFGTGPLNCLNSTSQVKELTWDTFKNRCKLKSLPNRDKAVVPQILLVSKLTVFQYVKEFTYVLHKYTSPLFSPSLPLCPSPPHTFSFSSRSSVSLLSSSLLLSPLSPLPSSLFPLPLSPPPPEWHSTLCGSACAPGLSLPMASAAYNGVFPFPHGAEEESMGCEDGRGGGGGPSCCQETKSCTTQRSLNEIVHNYNHRSDMTKSLI